MMPRIKPQPPALIMPSLPASRKPKPPNSKVLPTIDKTGQ